MRQTSTNRCTFTSPNLTSKPSSGSSRLAWPSKEDSKTMSLTKLSESSESDTTKSLSPGSKRKISGTIAKIKITIDPEFRPLVPVLIPDLDAVRALAEQLHKQNEHWQGEAFGWDVEYHP